MAEARSAAGTPAGPSPAAGSPGAGSPAAGLGRMTPRRRAVAGVAALAVVLAVALAIGAGVGSSGQPTNAQRAAAIDAQVRCPSCEDLSVAQSSASDAVAVRHEVARLVARGESASQVEATLVDQYGTGILLRPSTSGLVSLVWFVPAVAGALALVILASLLWRRSRQLRRLREESQREQSQQEESQREESQQEGSQREESQREGSQGREAPREGAWPGGGS